MIIKLHIKSYRLLQANSSNRRNSDGTWSEMLTGNWS
jgi:hypothetical protein